MDIYRAWYRTKIAALLAVVAIATPAAAQIAVDKRLPEYKPIEMLLSGTLRPLGSDTMNNLTALWAEEFIKIYPNVRFEIESHGNTDPMALLMTGTYDFVPAARDFKPEEIEQFRKKFGAPPVEVTVAWNAIAVFVHKDNPIDSLSLEQVDAIFSKTRKRGHGLDIATWGQLGLKGEHERAAISLAGRNSASGTYSYFKVLALANGDFKDTIHEQPGSSAVVHFVAIEPSGIGYSGIGYKTDGVRAVPLKEKSGGKPIPADAEHVGSGKYPLSRRLGIAMPPLPREGLDPLRREFLRFILSRQGQEIVVKDGYFPLPFDVAAQEAKKAGITLQAAPFPSQIGVDERFPDYESNEKFDGRLRTDANIALFNLLTLWAEDFIKQNPAVRISAGGRGIVVPERSLLEERADLVIMNREFRPDYIESFRKRHRGPPVTATCGYDALAVSVHKDNPLESLSLRQLDAIYSKTRKRGFSADISTWGQMGLKDKREQETMAVFGRNAASESYFFFKERALANGEFKDSVSELPGSAAVVSGIAADPLAIGYTVSTYQTDGVRAVPLSIDDKDKPVPLEIEHIVSSKYSLSRRLTLAVRPLPQEGLDPLRREFVRFVYSRQGQELVLKEGYIPVSFDVAVVEAKKLGLALETAKRKH